MNKSTRNALLLVSGALTAGIIPALYSRYRTKPQTWSVEQRKKNRLSVQLEGASGCYEDPEQGARAA